MYQALAQVRNGAFCGHPVVVLAPLREALRPLGVGALRRVVHRVAVVVAEPSVSSYSPTMPVDVVVVDPRRERVAEVQPRLLVVAGVEEDVGPLVAADDSAGRVLVQVGLRLVQELLDLGLGVAEVVDAVVLGDPGEPDLHVPLERDVLVEVGLVPDRARVDVAVEDHPAHLGRERRPVDRAEVGAVGEAVVVDLRLPQGLADALHVLGRVDRGHVVEQRRRRSAAGLRRSAFDLAAARRAVSAVVFGDVLRPRAGRSSSGSQVSAGHARADAARVPADPVVVVADAVRHVLAEGRQAEAASRRGRPG